MRYKLLFIIMALIFSSCNSTVSNQKKNQETTPYTITGYSHDRRLKEVSGMVGASEHLNHFWVHNDSGDKAVLYRVNNALEILQEVLIEGAQNIDWEDIAIGKYKGERTLFIGDIGDNRALRKTISVYLINEPKPHENKVSVTRKIDMQYQDGARDAEALLYDANAEELVIVTKRDVPSRVYSYALDSEEAETVLAYQGNIKLTNETLWDKKELYRITGGDASEKRAIILKNYKGVFYYSPKEKQSIKDRLTNQRPTQLQYEMELQGEAITLDDNGYWVTSECADDGIKHVAQPLYFYPDFLPLKKNE